MYTVLLSEAWALFIATGKERFITTDNPGFSIDEQNSHNMKLLATTSPIFPYRRSIA